MQEIRSIYTTNNLALPHLAFDLLNRNVDVRLRIWYTWKFYHDVEWRKAAAYVAWPEAKTNKILSLYELLSNYINLINQIKNIAKLFTHSTFQW